MVHAAAERLKFLIETVPALLSAIPAEDFNRKPNPDKWSKKEIVGHLIDSAANNHQRFVRGQFEDTPFIVYDQDKWNTGNHYNDMAADHVIMVWTAYNKHLVEVVQRIPADRLTRLCKTNEPKPVSLEWLIKDYVKHLEHHLRQVIPDGVV